MVQTVFSVLRRRIFTNWLIVLSIGTFFSISSQPGNWVESFTAKPASLTDMGFREGKHWILDTSLSAMQTTSPGGWSELADVKTPVFKVDRRVGNIQFSWKVQFPTDNSGASWRELNKIYVRFLDSTETVNYSLMYKPNRTQDLYTSYDLELKRGDGTVLARAWTHELTPCGAGSEFVRFSVNFEAGRIDVTYDSNNGEGDKNYISVVDSTHVELTAMQFMYRTGEEQKNYFVRIDDIRVHAETIDSDGDKVPDIVESMLGTNPANAGTTPEVGYPKRAPSSPGTDGWTSSPLDQYVTYEYSHLTMFQGNSGVPVVIPGDAMEKSLNPVVEIKSLNELGLDLPELKEKNAVIGDNLVFEVHGIVTEGSMVRMGFPFPGNSWFPPEKMTVYHHDGVRWVELEVDGVTEDGFYVEMRHFSPLFATAESSIRFVDAGNVNVPSDPALVGKSWEYASPDLMLTLEDVRRHNSDPANANALIEEIWVAEGVYKPSITGNRDKSFELIEDVELVGGFPSVATPHFGLENLRSDFKSAGRDPIRFKTILCGDLKGDDNTSEDFLSEGRNNSENSKHVVRVIDETGTCNCQCESGRYTIDGFVIRRGFNTELGDKVGAGILSDGALEINNCTLEENFAEKAGGAIYASLNLYVNRCRFLKNGVSHQSPSDGVYPLGGGAIFAKSNNHTEILNSVFARNTGSCGGAITIHKSEYNCFFQVLHSTFYNNKGYLLSNGSISYTGNSIRGGGGLKESIFWNDGGAEYPLLELYEGLHDASGFSLKNCCVRYRLDHGIVGPRITDLGGNIGEEPHHDPKFVNPQENDFYLEDGSPCVFSSEAASMPSWYGVESRLKYDLAHDLRLPELLSVQSGFPSSVPNGKMKMGAYGIDRLGQTQISAGCFHMGSEADIAGAGESPIHKVTLSRGLIADRCEITQGQFVDLMGYNPTERGTRNTSNGPSGWSSLVRSPNMPVTRVTWTEAMLYCNERSKREKLEPVYSYADLGTVPKDVYGESFVYPIGLTIDYSKNGYRLPTEAEWEYLCRAGTKTRYWWGESFDYEQEYTHARGGALNSYSLVGRKIPNPSGLFDMLGNAPEWCNNWNYSYSGESVTDPTGPSLDEGYNLDPDNYEGNAEDEELYQDAGRVKAIRDNVDGSDDYYYRSASRDFFGIYGMHVYKACYNYPGFRCVRTTDAGNAGTCVAPESGEPGDRGAGSLISDGYVVTKPATAPDGTAPAYEAGTEMTVEWYENSGEVWGAVVELSIDRGLTWTKVTGETKSSNTITFTLPTTDGDGKPITTPLEGCKILVSDYMVQGLRGLSDPFAILPPR